MFLHKILIKWKFIKTHKKIEKSNIKSNKGHFEIVLLKKIDIIIIICDI